MDSVLEHFEAMSLSKQDSVSYKGAFVIFPNKRLTSTDKNVLYNAVRNNGKNFEEVLDSVLYKQFLEAMLILAKGEDIDINTNFSHSPLTFVRLLLTNKHRLSDVLDTPFSRLFIELITSSLPDCFTFHSLVINIESPIMTPYKTAAIFMDNGSIDPALTLAEKFNLGSKDYYEDFFLNTIFVSESRKEELIKKLRRKIETGSCVHAWIKRDAEEYVNMMKSKGAKTFSFFAEDKAAAVILDVLPIKNKCHLPIIHVIGFRTAAEAVRMANLSHNCAISIWCENISLATGIANKLKSPTVWINQHGKQDVRIPICNHYSDALPPTEMLAPSNIPNSITLPAGLNIIARKKGPIGPIKLLYDPKSTTEVFLKNVNCAIICGNRVYLDKPSLPTEILDQLEIRIGKDRFVLVDEPTDHAEFIGTDKADHLLYQKFSSYQYIWLPEPEDI